MFPTTRKASRTIIITALLALGMVAAHAQVTPQNPPTIPPTVPAPTDPPAVPNPDRTTRPATQDPTPNQGWVFFNDRVGNDLGINDDQLTRLRDLDTRYRTEYDALGKDPMTNVNYRTLTDRRNTEVKTILTPDQNKLWMERYNPAPKPNTPPKTGVTTPK